ncbi:uncharacterized protein LOC125178253 [Hyalella azteca]|uniref:Uncharacterized protein LOC125178253 n=1 Tax=Hyalella azteca TaxID=294128 RepID=A0A979FKL8_HYAAZ|nr:uncharacterized protein LOC125178253 [Hyalella azteca]
MPRRDQLPDLSSDHLPIIITLPSTKGTNWHTSQTIRNYNRSSWEEFTRETKVCFQELNTQPITNIDHTLTHFNTIIAEADKKYVPKGNRKKYNPNFTPDISRLIRTRNNLRCTPTPLSQATTDHIHELNEQIKTSIRNRQKQRWEEFHAGLQKTPEEIQQIGFNEVARIEAPMQEFVYELGYNMSTQNFSNMILNDPANFYTTAEVDLLNGFRYVVYNVTTPAVPLIFKNIPSAEIIVQADPTGTGAYYLAGSDDGSRPGVFYVGTQDLNSSPKYGMLTLSLHEGNLGHHLQGSYALESPNLPYFRSAMEDRNYGYAPSRFPIRACYMEGWGLYAESTGFDMNLYGDLLERYGHYSDEIFRACRLVVDTGMHALGWTRQEAVDYILQYTAQSALENEVDRYITWPGQALAYKSGPILSTNFRSSAEQQLGSQFDIKDFHDVILDSLGPMSVVEEEVNEWIASTLNP